MPNAMTANLHELLSTSIAVAVRYFCTFRPAYEMEMPAGWGMRSEGWGSSGKWDSEPDSSSQPNAYEDRHPLKAHDCTPAEYAR